MSFAGFAYCDFFNPKSAKPFIIYVFLLLCDIYTPVNNCCWCMYITFFVDVLCSSCVECHRVVMQYSLAHTQVHAALLPVTEWAHCSSCLCHHLPCRRVVSAVWHVERYWEVLQEPGELPPQLQNVSTVAVSVTTWPQNPLYSDWDDSTLQNHSQHIKLCSSSRKRSSSYHEWWWWWRWW